METKLEKTLQLLASGSSLQDDTYKIKFLEALAGTLDSSEDIERLQLLKYCEHENDNEGVVSMENDDDCGAFDIELSTIIIKTLPDLTLEFLKRKPFKFISSSSPRLPYILLFYMQALDNNRNHLNIIELLTANKFWEEILFPVCTFKPEERLSNYLVKDAQKLFAKYVKFALVASDANQSPKGCQIKLKLEENLIQIIKSKLKSDNDLFDYLNGVRDVIVEEQHQEFLNSVMKDNIDFDVIKTDHEYLRSRNMLTCLIATKIACNEVDNLKFYLESSLIPSGEYSDHVKKQVIGSIVKFKPLWSILIDFLNEFLDACGQEIIPISQCIASCLILHSSNSDLEELAPKLSLVIGRFFALYLDNENILSQKSLRSICEVAMKLFSQTPNLNVGDLVETLLSISSQALSFDHQIRNSTLQLLKTILRQVSGERFIEVSSLVSKLCLIVGDTRNLDNVRDSALECLLQILKNNSLKLLPESCDKILFVSKKCLEEKHSTLRATSLDVVAALNRILPRESLVTFLHVYPETSTRGIDLSDMFSEQERLRMVTIASDLWSSIEDKEFTEKILFFILSTQQYDTFWEARLRTANFWKSVKEKCLRNKNKNDQLQYLEDNYYFTGIILGLLDYEETVKIEYHEMIKENDLSVSNCNILKDTTNTLMMCDTFPSDNGVTTNGTSHQTLETGEIEGILGSNDVVLMNMLGKPHQTSQNEKHEPLKVKSLSVNDFSQALKKIELPENISKDPMDVLNSIMDDILQSSSEENMIDLIDCY